MGLQQVSIDTINQRLDRKNVGGAGDAEFITDTGQQFNRRLSRIDNEGDQRLFGNCSRKQRQTVVLPVPTSPVRRTNPPGRRTPNNRWARAS